MRRASLVAPLLLIAIGALFLARNLYPNLALYEYAARFWPCILVIWGALRLGEILVWKAQEKPLPASGISGGEWMLVLLLCIIGGGMHAARGFAASWPNQVRINGMDFLGQPFEYPVDEQKQASKTPHILLDEFRGDVRVTGNDGDLVKVMGHKTIRSLDQEGADRLSKTSMLEITGDPNDMTVRASRNSGLDGRRVTYNLEISAPKGARIEVRGQNGDLEAQDLAGVTFTSERGDARVRNISGTAQFSIRRGDVHVEADHVPGQLDVSSGDIAASNVIGSLRISARSGDVKVTDANGPIDVSVARGDVELRPGTLASSLRAHSRNGDITLAMPTGAQFSIDASTQNGDVSNDFGELKTETNRHRGTLRGTIGKGPSIELQTNRGDLAVRKAGNTSSTQAGALEKLDQ